MKKFYRILILAATVGVTTGALSGCVVYPEHPAYGYGYGYDHHGYWQR
jgi:hypothetical protein